MVARYITSVRGQVYVRSSNKKTKGIGMANGAAFTHFVPRLFLIFHTLSCFADTDEYDGTRNMTKSDVLFVTIP